MIESKNNVPYIYRTSRDYKALLKLLDIVTCVNKNDIDNIISLINPDRCPDKYLPLLASYVGYKYDYNLPYDTNRNIIKYYPNLIRLRGNEEGIKLAAAVAINSSDSRYSIQSASDMVNVNYDKELGMVMVYMYSVNYLSKLNDLLDVVRPVGLGCAVVSSNAVRSIDKVYIEDKFDTVQSFYDINSLRFRITDYNNAINNRNTESNTVTINLELPGSAEIVQNSLEINIPVYMSYSYTYKYDYNEYNIETHSIVVNNKEIPVTDNVLKSIYVVSDSNGNLSCSNSDPFICSIGDYPYKTKNAFTSVFNSGSIDKDRSITIRLNLSDTNKGINNVISIIDVTAKYKLAGDNRVHISKFRNELGFGTIESKYNLGS